MAKRRRSIRLGAVGSRIADAAFESQQVFAALRRNRCDDALDSLMHMVVDLKTSKPGGGAAMKLLRNARHAYERVCVEKQPLRQAGGPTVADMLVAEMEREGAREGVRRLRHRRR